MKKIHQQIKDYLKYCEKVRQMTEPTLNAKQNVLKRFLECIKIENLSELDNETFNNWVSHETMRGVSPRSINTYNSIILAMIRYYREIGLNIPLNLSLIGKLKEGRLRRNFYSREEISEVLKNTEEETALKIKIMFETGMRIAELRNLKISDFYGRRVKFIGKGRKPREAYITEKTLKELNEYINIYKLDNYLWAVQNGIKTLNGEPPTINTIRLELRNAFLQAGFCDFYPHALRHSFATDLQLKGATVEEIKEMIGHESVATTERYLHGFDGRLEELFDKYQGMD